jgi:hypothetical protein
MKNPFDKKDSEYDALINQLLLDMQVAGPDSEEYPKMMKHLENLRNWRVEEQSTARVSPDKLAEIAGGLLTVLIIVGYERTNVITTKALSFLHRGKS